MAQGWLNAPEGGVSSPGAARDELGAPRIVTGAEAAEAMGRLGYNVENMTSMLPTMNKIVDSTTSLIDNAYNRQLAYRKSLADLGETAARTSLYGAQADNIQTEADLHKQTMDLDVQAKKVGLQRDQLALQTGQIGLADAQRNQQIASDAYDEYPAYSAAMSALKPDDPDLDDEIATIKRKYSNASGFGATEARVAGMEADLYARRKNSTTFQYNSAMMGGLEKLQEQQLLPSTIDVRKEVLNGNGDALLQQANKMAVNKRLDTLDGTIATNPNATPVDRAQVSMLKNSINNPAAGQGPVFGHDGSLNAADEAQIGQLERKYGLTPQYPGAKMTITRKLNKDTGQMETEREITGMPPTEADILAAEGVGAAGGKPYNWAQDTEYQQALTNFANNPNNANLTGDAKTNAFITELHRLKDAAGKPWPGQPPTQGGDQTGANAPLYAKPKEGQTPTLPVQPNQGYIGRKPPRRAGGAEAGNLANPEVQPVSYQPGEPAGGGERLATSNNDYRYPEEAGDVLGINRNVWANVMSEEGPGFGVDPGTNHMSVFGLWADSPDVEGEAYDVVRRYGANSPQAFNAVTAAWTDKFLKQSQPWELTSPGLQEMVIADSQHRGGASARKIIDEMGGFAAVNNMKPGDAIDEYARLRTGLWPGNMGRVIRERNWALQNDATLRGGQRAGAQVTTASAGPAAAPPGQQPAAPATAAAAPQARTARLAPLTPLQFRPTEPETQVAQYLPRGGAAA
jgi:hypothetical protein